MSQPNYYGIIPANVRYDKAISDGAKLLYCEITALANKEGYCWATNAYFAELYGKHENSISRLVSELQKAGHIQVDVIKSESGTVRHIYPLNNIVKTGGKQNCLPGLTNSLSPLNKNEYHNNTSNITSNNALNSIEFKEKEKSASEEKSEFSTVSLNTEAEKRKKVAPKKEKATEQPAEQLTEEEAALIESAKAGNRKMTEAQILRYEQPENVFIGVWSLFKEYAIARHKFKKPYTASVYAAQVEKLNKHYLDYQIEAWDAHLREAKERLWESPFFAGFKDHLSKLTKNTNHATHTNQSNSRNNEPRTGEKIGYAMAELLEGINTEYLERKQREQSSRSGFH